MDWEDVLLVSFNKLILCMSITAIPMYGCLMLPGNGEPLSGVRQLTDIQIRSQADGIWLYACELNPFDVMFA